MQTGASPPTPAAQPHRPGPPHVPGRQSAARLEQPVHPRRRQVRPAPRLPAPTRRENSSDSVPWETPLKNVKSTCHHGENRTTLIRPAADRRDVILLHGKDDVPPVA